MVHLWIMTRGEWGYVGAVNGQTFITFLEYGRQSGDQIYAMAA
jgi:hypothetical protein